MLAIDTSTKVLSLALVRYVNEEHELLGHVDEQTQNNQSEILMSRIEQLLQECGVTPADLDRIGVAVGPGSYTGVRVGVTAAKSLGYALGIPVTPVSSLQVMIWVESDADVRVPMMDARRGTVFAAAYYAWGDLIVPEGHYEIEAFIEKVLVTTGHDQIAFIGDGALAHKERLVSISPKWVEVHAEEALSSGKAEAVAFYTAFEEEFPPLANTHDLKPNYLRKTEAEMNAGV